ncbi:MAG: hypothetical protein H6751_14395 [Candidatus Omnitrophica bacterium]|nr:hypothetical protein [Candidatus Omnitrophota bacterium]
MGSRREPRFSEILERRIDAADREIDSIVYELYGLTDMEIALVEGRGEGCGPRSGTPPRIFRTEYNSARAPSPTTLIYLSPFQRTSMCSLGIDSVAAWIAPNHFRSFI